MGCSFLPEPLYRLPQGLIRPDADILEEIIIESGQVLQRPSLPVLNALKPFDAAARQPKTTRAREWLRAEAAEALRRLEALAA